MSDMDAPELIEWAKAPGARFVLLSGCAQKGAGTTPLQYRQRMKKAGDKLISPEPWEPARENAKNDRRARRRRNGADASLHWQGGARLSKKVCRTASKIKSGDMRGGFAIFF